MNLQGWLDRVVSDHRPAAATLRYDLERTIPRVAEMWKPYFDDPRDIHGQAFCTDIRLALLRLREMRGPMRGDTLLTSCGSGLSVVVSDSRGMDFRVRRWPTKVLSGNRVRVVVTPQTAEETVSAAQADPGQQMRLDEGAERQLFPAPMATKTAKPEIFALWWPTEDCLGLAEAVLAAVVDVDSASRVQILATTALPPVTDSPLLSQPKRTITPDDDFGGLAPEARGTGTDDPDDPKPA